MKIGVPMVINSIDEKASARFARAEYFAFIDIESKDIEFKINPHTEEAHGAGTRVITWCVENKSKIIIADQLGPNANAVVSANPDLKAYLSGGLALKDIHTAYVNNQLVEFNNSGSQSGGRGQGRGQGGGRGQGIRKVK